jgi:hypothetical protein
VTIPPPPQAEIDAWLAEIDVSTPEQLWDIWNRTRSEGLGDYHASPFVILRNEARSFDKLGYLGLGGAAAGLLLVSTAFLLRRRQR